MSASEVRVPRLTPAGAHCRLNMRQARIEMLERARVTLSVSAMAVKHVEVDQVGKNQSTRFLLERADSLIDRLLVVLCCQIPGHSQRIVNRSNLAYANHVESLVFQSG